PRKAAMFCVVALAALADEILETKGFKYNCRYLVICFYFANEGLSILENVINAGLPVPKQLKNMLEQCRDKQEIKTK
ncbi:toxin secretion/phage lysis holin, partial [Fusobacterium sp. PH5-7]|uniref:phage holin family protein n=1 Tax=Fusobacterium sp. PH5-7 TaxID=2940528 RepID=UPI0024766590